VVPSLNTTAEQQATAEHAAREAACVSVFRSIMLAHHQLHAEARRTAARYGLHIAELNVIDMLGKLGPITMGALSCATFISSANTTHTVKKLEMRGYVQRQRCRTSRREVEVSLTPSGKRLFCTCYPGIVGAMEQRLATLSMAQRQTLVALLGRIIPAAAESDPT